MRTYELMVVFPLEEDAYNPGIEAARESLKKSSAEIISEEVYGDRDLAYEIKKKSKGRYILFNIKVSPDRIVEIDRQLKLNTNILTFLFVRVE